ncbi:MAG: glycosyltransferase [Chitinophagaceae bacterium]|nr:MAG: glycosyltransferase [Chitinophagaceae bacterium]
MKFHLYIWKRRIEDVLMFPLILLGRLIGRLGAASPEYETYFFFPFYHIGGAEKVHAQIALATGNERCIIYFTRKSQNDLFHQLFADSKCTLRDVSRYTDNKWIYFVNIIFRGIISGQINRQKLRPLVFNGQCNFGYKISPWIRRDVPQIELIHSLCSFSYIRIPFLPFIDATVMISTIRIREHIDLYRRYGVPALYDPRIRFIMNAISLPEPVPRPLTEAPLTLLYVGRSTPEKRVHLIAEMAQAATEAGLSARFEFLGEVKEAIPAALHSYCRFHGNQSDPAVIDRIYAGADVLLLVSDTEGFPMVVMEAMAKGLAIISTAVGEVPLHVKDAENGFLLQNFLDGDAVREDGLRAIRRLDEDRALLRSMAGRNIGYAFAHFGMERFNREYTQLFQEYRSQQRP